jgi:hypothetical protein
MRHRPGSFLVIVVVLCAAAAAQGPVHVEGVDYEVFMALEPEQRRETFSKLPPADKATIKKTHAERWLAANRPSLSPTGIAAMERAIAFVTPDLYQNQDPTAAQLEEERAIVKGLECSIGPERAGEAFALWPAFALGSSSRGLRRAVPQGSTDERSRFTKLVDRWFAWFENCVVS